MVVLQDLKAVPLWEIKLAQRITAVVGKSPQERVHSQGRVLADRSVLYKYMNPNLVVVLTQIEDPLYKSNISNKHIFTCIDFFFSLVLAVK